jgi:hypothetical protein
MELKTSHDQGWECSSVVEHLLSMHAALDLVTSIVKQN